MSLRRLRTGELLAAAGAIALVVALSLPWFGERSGWAALGWLMVALLVADVLLAVWMLATAAARGHLARAVAAAVVLAASSPFIALVLVLRTLAFAPAGDLRPAAWLGIAGAIAIAAGGWRAIADERTDAPESAVTPPPARPAP